MLFTPLDPVVATHRSRAQAEAAVAALSRAGFGRGMLSLVDADAAPALGAVPRAGASWVASGTLWGVLWIAAVALGTWTVPLHSPAFGAALMLGAVALVAQATLAARHLASEQHPLPDRVDTIPAPGAFSVLVHGSRSDVALARMILAA